MVVMPWEECYEFLYTKKPKFSFVKMGFLFQGMPLLDILQLVNEKTGHIDFNIGLKEWSFLTSATYTDFR